MKCLCKRKLRPQVGSIWQHHSALFVLIKVPIAPTRKISFCRSWARSFVRIRWSKPAVLSSSFFVGDESTLLRYKYRVTVFFCDYFHRHSLNSRPPPNRSINTLSVSLTGIICSVLSLLYSAPAFFWHGYPWHAFVSERNLFSNAFDLINPSPSNARPHNKKQSFLTVATDTVRGWNVRDDDNASGKTGLPTSCHRQPSPMFDATLGRTIYVKREREPVRWRAKKSNAPTWQSLQSDAETSSSS